MLSKENVVNDDEGVDCYERYYRQIREMEVVLLSSVRTAEMSWTSFLFAFGVVSMPNPVGSGGSAHPTALSLRVLITYL